MQDSIATASRDVLRIKRRKLSYLSFRGPQEVLRRLRPLGKLDSVTFAPPLSDRSTLSDIRNRLGWYFPRGTVEEKQLLVQVDPGLDTSTDDLPDCQRMYETEHLPIEFVSSSDRDWVATDTDAFALHDATGRFSARAVRQLRSLFFLDPTFYSGVEAGTWGTFSTLLRDEPEDDSEELFRRFRSDVEAATRAYVFATGPSLDKAMEMEFEEDSITIICNSIVRDDALLEHLDPDVLVFADDVFHFGPSEYAARFREDMESTLEQYDCRAIVPKRFQGLMAAHYPHLEFIGIEGQNVDEPIFPTPNKLEVMSTGNIMTLFMLPIASSLAEEVFIVGADGRKENESYFWEHNDDAQYDDSVMKTAVDCHPSFFRDRVYTDYYDQHVRTLTDFIEYGEASGIKYASLTESYVPCLRDRYRSPAAVGLN